MPSSQDCIESLRSVVRRYGAEGVVFAGGGAAACWPRVASAVPMRPDEVTRMTKRARTALGSWSMV